MKYKKKKPLWIISGGEITDFNTELIDDTSSSQRVKSYQISDLGRYILNPDSIEVKEKILGCNIFFKQPKSNRLKARMRKFLPKSLHGFLQDVEIPPQEIISLSSLKIPAFEDKQLEQHFRKLGEMLRPYNSALKKLSDLDPSTIEEVVGICEDIGSDNHYDLNLKGTIEEKIAYIYNNISNDVFVVLKNPSISDGLFEMRGYDFTKYNHKNSYRMIKYFKDGIARYCVLNAKSEVEFYVKNKIYVSYLHLLEQSIQSNEHLYNAFLQCIDGSAKPLRLYFTNHLEVTYSNEYIPTMYKKIFEHYNIGENVRQNVTKILNDHQRVVSFNYIPRSKTGNEKLFTNISVMHNVKALDPIKSFFPEFYSEINKITMVSEAGSYYLLDSMKGYRDV